MQEEQWSSCMDIQAGVPQGFILRPQNNLTSNPKLFADDILFSGVTDPNAAANKINSNLHNTNIWAYQWQMIFNPNTS